MNRGFNETQTIPTSHRDGTQYAIAEFMKNYKHINNSLIHIAKGLHLTQNKVAELESAKTSDLSMSQSQSQSQSQTEAQIQTQTRISNMEKTILQQNTLMGEMQSLLKDLNENCNRIFEAVSNNHHVRIGNVVAIPAPSYMPSTPDVPSTPKLSPTTDNEVSDIPELSLDSSFDMCISMEDVVDTPVVEVVDTPMEVSVVEVPVVEVPVVEVPVRVRKSKLISEKKSKLTKLI